jgi:hypothetical protein
MDFVTRQFIVLAKKLRKDLREAFKVLRRDFQQGIKSIRAKESEPDQRNIQPVWLDNVLTKYDLLERDKSSNQDEWNRKQHSVQNSIRWATWFAFAAAAIYAGITAGQLHTAHHALIEARESTNKQYTQLTEQINALNTANKISAAANRPWVGFSAYTDPRDAPTLTRKHDAQGEYEQLQFTWIFKNAGKRPAWISKILTTGHSYKVCSESPHYNSEPFSRAFLIPETTIKSPMEDPIPLVEWNRIQDTDSKTKLQYCVYSFIEYIDVDDPTHIHTTRDCRFLISSNIAKDPSFGECTNNYPGAD